MINQSQIKLVGGIADYTFYSFEDALSRILQWKKEGLATEKDLAAFIIQLFHSIPEDTYNDLINNS